MKHADNEAEILASHETANELKAFCGHLDFLFENGTVSQFEISHDCDYKGNDLFCEMQDYVEGCASRCFENPWCTHFTWVPEAWTGSPHCWMKHADTEAEILASHETAKDPKAFCGHLDFLFENGAVSQFEILRNCDYKDNDLFNEMQDYVEGCASRCFENP
uniref:Apple domain-containing protein n=1 Tax=Romanomermis culicivorax TaxID=13658 RepID=A0A915IK95_ROMCU